MNSKAWLSAWVFLAMALPAFADVIALNPVKDNTIFAATLDPPNPTDPPPGTTSNGAGSLFTGRTGLAGGETIQRALLAFDVAGNIPAGAVISSASLTLILEIAGPGSAGSVHNLHRLLSDWGEGTSDSFAGIGAPATPGDATWLHTFFPGQFWAAPGGDFDATVSSTQVIDDSFSYTWASTPQLVGDVQDMLDNPADNFGWMIRGNEELTFASKKWISRESPIPFFRPVLTVEFEAGQGAEVPTVSEWGLIVMTLLLLTAGTVIFGRRRVAAALNQ